MINLSHTCDKHLPASLGFILIFQALEQLQVTTIFFFFKTEEEKNLLRKYFHFLSLNEDLYLLAWCMHAHARDDTHMHTPLIPALDQ